MYTIIKVPNGWMRSVYLWQYELKSMFAERLTLGNENVAAFGFNVLSPMSERLHAVY